MRYKVLAFLVCVECLLGLRLCAVAGPIWAGQVVINMQRNARLYAEAVERKRRSDAWHLRLEEPVHNACRPIDFSTPLACFPWRSWR